jgi:transcriptional regulator with XRE-family HTH domain
MSASTAPRKRDHDDVIALQVLGARIRALRKHKLVAQDKLAHLAGIPRGHMTNVEAGRIDVKLTMLRRIARALDVHEHDLINADIPVENIPSRR